MVALDQLGCNMNEVVLYPHRKFGSSPIADIRLYSANIAGMVTEDGKGVRIIKNRYAPPGEIIPIDEFMTKYFTDMI